MQSSRQPSALPPGFTGINSVVVFDSLEISKDWTQDQLANFASNFQITVKADAVQTENVLQNYATDEWKNARDSFAVVEG